MIITVTLNAAIDKSLSVPNFRLGRRHRTVEQQTLAGGKGVNVARTLKTLGAPVIATGLAGGPTGTRIVEQLTEESILNDFVRIREESRTNTAVHDPTTGQQTEINERGPAVTEREIELFRDKLMYLAGGAELVVFAGSLPRGVEPDLYYDLIRTVAKAGITTVVDTDGEPLRHAVRAEPHVISPNILEAEELVGHEFNDDEDMVIAVREMRGLGAREAIMTTARRLLRERPGGRRAHALPRAHRAARDGGHGRRGGRLPRGLRRRALRRRRSRGVPAPGGRVRRRVDPAAGRGSRRSVDHRAARQRDAGGAGDVPPRCRNRACASASVGTVRGCRHRVAGSPSTPPRGSSRPPSHLGCAHGD